MANLTLKTLNQYVSDMVTSWQASLGITTALPSGDPALAMFQAVGVQLLFVQSLIQIVENLTRAQTSTGSDLDSWMAQFNFPRLPAVAAEGPVTCSSLTPEVAAAQLKVGAIIQTPGGAVQYQAIADANQAAYSPTQNAYVLQVGQTSMSVTVQALQPGTSYNVQANVLTQYATAVPSLDLVTNPAAISNGQNAESDQAYINRFILYLGSLAKATAAAITAAINSVQQGLTSILEENTLPNGTPQLGTFTAVVDDGSGSPPSGLITSVYNAIYAARAFTITPYAVGATKVSPPIVLNIKVSTAIDPTTGLPYASATVEANVSAAIQTAVNALPVGGTIYVSLVESAATSTPGVVSVQPGATTINGVNADYAMPLPKDVARIAPSNVTVGTY